jgi:hypothetical protein
VLDGAAVRVSQLGFGDGFRERRLEGIQAIAINADLTGSSIDLTKAAQFVENAGVAFMGDTKGGRWRVADPHPNFAPPPPACGRGEWH